MWHIFTAILAFETIACQAIFGEDTAELARQIIKANRNYAASLNSLRVEYEIPGSIPEGYRPADGSNPIRTEDTWWSYARSGRREVIFTDPLLTSYGRNLIRTWASFNGSQGVSMSYAISDPNSVEQVYIVPGRVPSELQSSLIHRALGWYCHGFGSLVSLMETADHSEIEREPAKLRISGEVQLEFPAVKWRIKRFKDRNDLPEHEIIVWVSKEHHWLPRMIAVNPIGFREATGGLDDLNGCRFHEISVLEFTKVDDPLLGESRDFPKTIRDMTLGWDVANVTSISVNQVISADLFDPVITPGALIVREPGTGRESREYFGGDEGKRFYQELIEKNKAFLGYPNEPVVTGPISANLGHVNAKPETLNWQISPILVVGALLLLTLVGARLARGRFS